MTIVISKPAVTPPYGMVSIADLKAAADHLTDSGFKAWALLALNQNGYRWNGELSHSVASELERWGYLVPLDDGNNVFCPSGDVEGEAPGYPAAWTAIAELYGVPESEYSRIANRLKDYHLLEKVDSILSYWAGAYDDLQTSVDHSKSQIPLMFDLSVVLVWWIRDHFSFKVGGCHRHWQRWRETALPRRRMQRQDSSILKGKQHRSFYGHRENHSLLGWGAP